MRNQKVYDTIYKLSLASGMHRHDADAFYAAYEAARDSTFGHFEIGCVITVKNRIVSRGWNSEKTSPTQKEYNISYRDFKPADYCNREHSLHAEISAIKALSYPITQQTNWSRAKAYIYRIAPGLPYKQGIAAPCCACAHALADLGVRKVYFSTDYGFASSKLDVVDGLIFD